MVFCIKLSSVTRHRYTITLHYPNKAKRSGERNVKRSSQGQNALVYCESFSHCVLGLEMGFERRPFARTSNHQYRLPPPVSGWCLSCIPATKAWLSHQNVIFIKICTCYVPTSAFQIHTRLLVDLLFDVKFLSLFIPTFLNYINSVLAILALR